MSLFLLYTKVKPYQIREFRLVPALTFEFIVKSNIGIPAAILLGGEAGAEPNSFYCHGFTKLSVGHLNHSFKKICNCRNFWPQFVTISGTWVNPSGDAV
jgi:hypothetical protein